jgi:hypothetical protein
MNKRMLLLNKKKIGKTHCDDVGFNFRDLSKAMTCVADQAGHEGGLPLYTDFLTLHFISHRPEVPLSKFLYAILPSSSKV